MPKSLAEQQFGPHAAHYATSTVHAAGESLGMLVARIAPTPEWRVLDVATGAGHMAAAIAPHVAEVVASDITEEMLAETARMAVARGLANVGTTRAEAGALPFADASFDAVVCRLAAHHFPSIPRFVAEVRRVLVPGGTFGLVDNVGPDAEILPGHTADGIAAADAAYDAFERLRDPSHVRALTREEWRRVITREGVSIASEELIAKELAFGPWVERMSCDPATVLRLEAMLEVGPAPLIAFLQPRGSASARHFVLREYILVATAPA
ncbi:MAG: methyltransferase domain-containing protein [Pseudomonadota bacterium]